MSTQGNYLAEIANAIRTKEGSSATIKANQFASRILALSCGVQLSDTTAASASTQEGYLKVIADAIRAKEGSTGTIPANTFAARILALEDTTPTTWSSGTLPVSANAVTYGNGKFVVAGAGTLAYSSDGKTWAKASLSTNTTWNHIAYGSGKFVAVTLCRTYSAYSKDAISWTVNADIPSNSASASDGYGERIIYGNNGFIILPNISYQGSVSGYLNTYLLGDGESGWTKKETLPASSQWYSGAYGNGKYVIVNGSPYVAYSADASAWDLVSLPSSAKANFKAFTYGSDKFVALGYASQVVIYSADGITWKQAKLPVSGYWSSVAYGAGMYIAVENKDNSAKAVVSPDGITWEEITLPTSNAWKSIAYGGGKFVVVSGTSFLRFS